MHDLVIRGVVHDGLGSPGGEAEVAIDAERIVAVGRDVGPGPRTIVADVCVFDPETIAHPGSYTEPLVAPVGMEHVVLGGRVVVDQRAFTGVRAGKVVRAR